MYNKFRAKKETVDGVVFASKKEAARYRGLKLLERAGEIKWLNLQPSFDIRINGDLVCKYIADFEYWDKGMRVIEDVKGCKKGAAYQIFRLKKKLMKAVHGIEVLET